MVGNRVSPCPACSGMGTIPDGEYTPTGGNIFDTAQWLQVTNALQGIRNAILRGDSVEQVREAIESDSTLAAYLKNFIPQNLKDLQTLLIIIGMVYAAIRIMYASPSPQQLMIPQPAAEIVNEIIHGSTDAQQIRVDPESAPEPKSASGAPDDEKLTPDKQ